MSQGLSSLGLTGLTANTQKREQASRDLETLGKMVQMKEADEAKEQQAALVEQQYYERIRAEADKLLSGDRTAVNEKAKQIQAEIKNNIRLYGGSKAKFMANGGLSLIGNYSSQILDSDELATYRSNKENLTKILDIKEKNMGHLLTQKDREALENYERNGRGTITYNGLLSEIEIPNSNEFDYGYEMTPLDILNNGKNRMKAISNWMLEYPELNRPPSEQELLAFVATRYGGRGTNQTALQYKAAAAQSEKTSKDEEKRSTSGDLAFVLTSQREVPLEKMTTEGFLQHNFIKNAFGGRAWGQKSEKVEVLGQLEGIFGTDQDHTYKARGAVELPSHLNTQFFNTQNGEGTFTIENGVVKDLDPKFLQGTVWNGRGDLIPRSGANSWFRKDDYRLMGSFMGWEIIVEGKPTLVMDAMNENGGINEDRQKEMYKNETGGPITGKPVMVMMMKSNDMTYDEYIYQKVDYDDITKQKQLSVVLDKLDDITDASSENNRNQNQFAQGVESRDYQKAIKPQLNISDYQEAFSSEMFKEQGRVISSSQPRNALRQAFYLAIGQLAGPEGINNYINQDQFNVYMETYGLTHLLKNPNISDADILARLIPLVEKSDRDPNVIKNNMSIVDTMKNYLPLIKAKK